MRTVPHLRIVRAHPDTGSRPDATADLGDLLLIATLFVLNLMPLAGALAGIGRWSPAIVGFAAGAALLTGRELFWELWARVHWRR
jgi:uncharacterized membrane protein (DUF4010 family)